MSVVETTATNRYPLRLLASVIDRNRLNIRLNPSIRHIYREKRIASSLRSALPVTGNLVRQSGAVRVISAECFVLALCVWFSRKR